MDENDIQTAVSEAVRARGYFDGFTAEALVARQVAKAVEELAEAAMLVHGAGEVVPGWPAMIDRLQQAAQAARLAFGARHAWGQAQVRLYPGLGTELADVAVPLLVAAEQMQMSLNRAALSKALADVQRGVRQENP